MENDIQQKVEMLSQMQLQLESDLKQICYLHKNIQSISMCPINDFTKEYLEKQIDSVDKNPNLTTEKAILYKENYTQQLKNYLHYKSILDDPKIKDGDSQLSDEELIQVESRKKEVQNQLMKDIKDVRNQYHEENNHEECEKDHKDKGSKKNFISHQISKFKFW